MGNLIVPFLFHSSNIVLKNQFHLNDVQDLIKISTDYVQNESIGKAVIYNNFSIYIGGFLSPFVFLNFMARTSIVITYNIMAIIMCLTGVFLFLSLKEPQDQQFLLEIQSRNDSQTILSNRKSVTGVISRQEFKNLLDKIKPGIFLFFAQIFRGCSLMMPMFIDNKNTELIITNIVLMALGNKMANIARDLIFQKNQGTQSRGVMVGFMGLFQNIGILLYISVFAFLSQIIGLNGCFAFLGICDLILGISSKFDLNKRYLKK
ncbi:UNKNOWN [Stylonychia lemnae]|uniref:Uncharacterized protein n=1 Tax=Stylonychia lemnae TaxID=5949 RepID=A0A078A4U9_STYLE|nr:UNKNOWN [Stylonychia lemnae]|eukprot:CDW77290.1 UNKNOWN [Stylonychia lemnae]